MNRLFVRLALTAAGLLFAATALARPVPLLWVAKKGETEVHLLGSFHMLKDSDYPMDPSIEQAYAGAEALVFEIAPAEMKSPDLSRGLMQAARFEDGGSLRAVLPADTRKKLEAFMGEAAVLGSDGMKPWFITLNLAVSMIVQAGFNPALGMDMHFMQRAEADAKPTRGLETVADQIAALSGAPMNEQILGLEESLRPREEMMQRFDELHGFWRAGDADAIERLMVEELVEKTPVSAKLLNEDRNRRWLPQIEALLAGDEDTLVIVGALHLVGDIGLVELLRARGYSVERVDPTP
ncbi:MAG: TraB/GumN family protein [Lysobacterales bacterium]|jgi:uncharacterized protein YbaP (TraB family)